MPYQLGDYLINYLNNNCTAYILQTKSLLVVFLHLSEQGPPYSICVWLSPFLLFSLWCLS